MLLFGGAGGRRNLGYAMSFGCSVALHAAVCAPDLRSYPGARLGSVSPFGFADGRRRVVESAVGGLSSMVGNTVFILRLAGVAA